MMKVWAMIIVGAAFALFARADDWPQFMGPGRDGVSHETALNINWSKKPPTILWKANVGLGVSGASVVGGVVYSFGYEDGKDKLRCLEAATGKPVWEQAYKCKAGKRMFDGGTAATPTVDGGFVYTLSHIGQLFCWEAATGKLVWGQDLAGDLKGRKMQWGWSASPLVVGNNLIVDPGGEGTARVALDKSTGKVAWQKGNERAAYASAIIFPHAGKTAVAFFQNEGLIAFSPESGDELFRHPWKTECDANASTPLFHDGAFFLGSGYGCGCTVIDVGSGMPIVRWKNDSLSLHFQNSVLLAGKLYAVSGDNRGTKGELKCVDFKTGVTAWGVPLGVAYAHIIVAAGKLLIVTDQAELVLVDPNPEKYVELGRMKVHDQATRVVGIPSFANGLFYARSNSGELVCVDLRP
ncbi:MAG: PQQ-like beta-propeller repeat protein [Verrucomicrobia bacterium]|nr:PQQ-like beta-propeller repeat protein [Verrucomicrobiota bacterium]